MSNNYKPARMKKLLFTFGLLLIMATSIHGQSKISYALLFNSSGSIDPTNDVCVFEPGGGSCLGIEPEWKLNFMAVVNYSMSDRLRLQTGAGFNVYNLNSLNDALGNNEFSAKYLSIPIKGHYMLGKDKFRPYLGLGLRADIRVNQQAEQLENVFVQDNGAGFGMSLEGLMGFEFDLKPGLTFQLEPTFSQGIIAYDQDVVVSPTGNPNSTVLPFGMFADSLPTRIGFTFGLMFSPQQLFNK